VAVRTRRIVEHGHDAHAIALDGLAGVFERRIDPAPAWCRIGRGERRNVPFLDPDSIFGLAIGGTTSASFLPMPMPLPTCSHYTLPIFPSTIFLSITGNKSRS
jgi:hypothetical protein